MSCLGNLGSTKEIMEGSSERRLERKLEFGFLRDLHVRQLE